jgi:hypothetical protein
MAWLFPPCLPPQREKERRQEMMLESGRDKEEVEMICSEYVQTRMAELDTELQGRHGLSQAELMEAQTAHAEDPAIVELMNSLRTLIVGEEQAAQMEQLAASAPADMNADLFLPIFQSHVSFVEKKVVELFKKAAEETRGQSREERHSYLQFLCVV